MTGSPLPQTDLPAPSANADAPALVSYTQNGEDVRLWRVFKDVPHGFYVDVGAGDPWDGSVTRLFYDRGWSGINVEPRPVYEELAAARPRDVTIRAVVGDVDGTVPFFVAHAEGATSNLDPVDATRVPQRRLDAILQESGEAREIQFLKIDVVGAARHVLASMDFSAHRPIVVVVEAVTSSSATTHDEWESILLDADYVFATFDGVNRFYVDRAHSELGEVLAYPVSALDRFTPASLLRAQLEARRLAAKNAELRDELVHTRARLEEMTNVRRRESRKVDRLHDELAEVYGSRTWRAGRVVTRVGAPILGVARRLGRGRPRNRHPTPERAYAYATRPGQPWHFPDRGKVAKRPDSVLDPLIHALRPFTSPLISAHASRLRHEVDRTTWADDQSLAARRLSWNERQAIVEANALVELVAAIESSDAGVPRDGALSAGPIVVVDVRCLQHEHYRSRGVGIHARGILQATTDATEGASIHLLTSPELPDLDEDVAALGDHVVTTPYPLRDSDVSLFVQLSPMTETLGPATPFLSARGCRTAAAVYDFIPSEYPAAYLAAPAAQLTNLVRIEALRHYDLLLPISDATAATCRGVVGESGRLAVTGVASPLGAEGASPCGVDRYVLAPTGSDARKNCAAAIAALAYHLEHAASPMRLVVSGRLTGAQSDALREMARRLALPDDAIEVVGAVPARDLAQLYRSASLVFVASFAEGFSIPVAEAVQAGTPVVASDLPVHRELLGHGPWLAPPNDIRALGNAMSHVLTQRDHVLGLQGKALGDRADPDAVLARARRALSELVATPRRTRSHAPVRRSRHVRPRVAVVSPFPPQSSGVADYTAVTFGRVAEYADVDVYSSAPVATDVAIPVRPLSAAPYLDRRYDAVVSVVGNSHFHLPVLDLLTSYGGACIAHDNRMIESYGFDRGDHWVAELLSRHRPVDAENLADLLRDLDAVPSAGYDLIAQLATPLLVHSRSLARRIEQETGVAPVALPFVPYNLPSVDTIDAAVRKTARRQLGISDNVFHVATFGGVDRRTKGADLILAAASWLRDWGFPVQLHVVGDAPPGELRSLEEMGAELGIQRNISFHGRMPRITFEQFLLAADVAVQIRTSSMLSLSGGLADCLAFGIPTVTTEDLADEHDAPPYAMKVSSVTSSLLLAESIAALRDRRSNDPTIDEERRAYLERRSLDSYALGLLGSLGLGERT
jgi:FkbM family methyltransferase